MLKAQSTTKDYIRAEGDFNFFKINKRVNKAKIRPEEQREKSESCRENLWNEIQLKGPLKTEILESSSSRQTDRQRCV